MVRIQIHQKQWCKFHHRVHHQWYIHSIYYRNSIVILQTKKRSSSTYFPSSFHGAKHRSPVLHLIAVRVADDAAAVLFDCDVDE